MHDRNAKPGQVLLRANAGEHQQLRRVDGSAAQNDLARGTSGAEPAMLAKRHADRTAAFAPNLLGQGPGDDLEIGALHCRAEIADSGRAALSVACRRLVVAYPVLAGAVEIVIARKAEPGRRGDKTLTDRVLRDIRHAERPVCAVEPIGAARLVLRASEIWQHIATSDTQSGPSVPWNRLAPRVWCSERLKYGSTSSNDQPVLPSWRQWSKSSA